MDSSFDKTPKKEHPLRNVAYTDFDDSKKKMIKKMLYLFVYFASRSSKHAFHELHESHFMELMVEIWRIGGKQLQKNRGTWKQLQILYYTKGRKNALIFRCFLEMLPTIGCYYEPELSREDSLRSLLHHASKFYDLKVLPQIDGKLINCKELVPEESRQFLGRLAGDLTRLYKVYFLHEIITAGGKKCQESQSLEAFEEFLKDFEIFPKIISARDVFYIYNEVCESAPSDLLYETDYSKPVVSEMGVSFTLSNFLDALIIISRRVFTKLKQIDNEEDWQNEHKFILRTLLEYMETVKSMTKKHPKYIHERFCLIVLDEHPEPEPIKTVQVNDKAIKEHASNMDFFALMNKIRL